MKMNGPGPKTIRIDVDEARVVRGSDIVGDDTIEVLEGLVAISTRVNHHVALAHYLQEDGRTARAREVLERGLANWETSPDFVQRRDEKWARRARKMLAQL